ncbi:uncharacterized protein LOC123503756 [Portunus trituberculatus]|nr:uncharacterized protein LOC123503756 [Portunus trituberculatus]
MVSRWCVLVVVVLVVVTSNATDIGPKTLLPDDVLFKDQAAFCEGCYAIVHEAEKLMTIWQKEKGSIEDHIDAAFLATCTTDRLRTYVLSPPKMVRLCSGIRAHYMDQLGMAVLKHYSKPTLPGVDQLFKDVCVKAIPACPKGITPMSVAREESRKKAAAEKAGKEEATDATQTKTTKTKTKKSKGQKETKQRTSSEHKDEL